MARIDNMTAVRIVDHWIREAMQQVETLMLPTAEQALADTGIALEEHPVEGYYGKTPKLTRYFQHIRTLQLHYSDKVTQAIRRLHEFYSDPVFGLGPALMTAINTEGVWYPHEPPAVISPMVDPLTIAVAQVGKNPLTIFKDMTIQNIMEALEKAPLGKGLVSLGVLADIVERKLTGICNPVSTTLTRETTVLSAYVPTMKACMPRHEYIVSTEVEHKANEVIAAYNSLFAKLGFNKVIIPRFTEEHAFQTVGELPNHVLRCVRIFNLALPGKPAEYYHWATYPGQEGLEVRDFWRHEVITTDMYKNGPAPYIAQRRG